MKIIGDLEQFSAAERGKCSNGSSKANGGERVEATDIGSSLELRFKGKE